MDVKRTEFVWRDGQYKCNCPNDQSGTYVLAAEYDAEKARADAAEARVKELEAKLASVPTATIADDATISVMTLPTPGGDVAAMLARIAKYDHDDGVSPLVAHDFGDAAALLESQAAALAAKDAEIEKLNRANKSLQNDLNEYLGR